MSISFKNVTFFFVDLLSFFFSLVVALFLRHFLNFNLEILKQHLFPFGVIFIFWFLIFYIFELYDFKKISFFKEYSKNYLTAVLISILITVFIFYALPIFSIAPKTLLLIFILIFVPLNLELRNFLLEKFAKLTFKKVALIGMDRDFDEIEKFLEEHKSLGIKKIENFRNLGEIIETDDYDVYIVSNELLRDEVWSNNLLKKLLEGKMLVSSLTFIENFLYKIPVDAINEEWVLSYLYSRDDSYEILKRFIDLLIASIVFAISLPLWPFIILGIKISSPGPVFFKDKRVGKNEKVFTLYKFRTMHEINYKKPEEKEIFGVKRGDERVFWFGKILRTLHFDEFPQLINVIKGDISLVGPRPDTSLFYDYLKEKIQNYRLRTLIKPGITGWAQINEKTGDSVEEAKERLAFDLYYLKNRNIILDLLIILKTLRILLTFWGK